MGTAERPVQPFAPLRAIDVNEMRDSSSGRFQKPSTGPTESFKSKLDPGASTATEIETAMDQMKAGGLSKRRSSAPPSLPALVPDALLLSMDGPPPTRNLVETKLKLPRELARLINNSPRSRRRSKSHIPVQDCANNDSSSEMPKAAGDLVQELHVGSVKGEEKHHHQECQLEQEEDVDVSESNQDDAAAAAAEDLEEDNSEQDEEADADEERRRYPARQRRSWVPVPLFTSHLIKESPRKRHKSMRGHKDPRSTQKHDNSRHISGYEHDTLKGAEHSRQRRGTHFSSDHLQRPRNHSTAALRSRDERRQEWEAAAAVDYNLRKRKELDYAEEDSYSDELDPSEELDHPLRYRRSHDNLHHVVNNQKVIAASRGRAAGQQHQNDNKAAGARQASNRVPAGVTDEGLVVGSYEKGKPRRLTRSTDPQHINGGHGIDTQQDIKKDKMKVENPEFSSSSDSSSSGTSSEDDLDEGEPDEQMRKLAEVRNKDGLQAGGESGQVTHRESSSEGCEDDDEHLEEEEEQRQQAAWNRERLRPRQPPPGSKPATNKQSNVRPTGHEASRSHSVSHRHHQSSRLRGGGGGGLSRPPRNADVSRGGRRGNTTVRWLHEEDELPAHQDPSAAWRGVSMGALGAPGGGGVFPTSPGVAALIASLGGAPGGGGGGNQLLPGVGSAARHHLGLPGSAAWDGLLAGGASVDPAAAGLFSRGGGDTKPPATATVNAEITPVQVDASVSFDQVGGLDHYVSALKEMVFLPLVYPELFERFKVQPPRGVLFYGPPGTGKTLVARALAAHASKFGKPVAFFMRKGADILSKWVGEAERQLRLLFEEAQKHQPSIIFFDEIDGLAPVRSSKQDQVHNSIVSTLLALMDGLDPRGQVVIIGATNRPDALDGALRRPGRFDRELLFPLPGLEARRSILHIHTSKWNDPPAVTLLSELATLTVGYCGADLKALCTEASLAALRRRYPQIYECEQKLLVKPSEVVVSRRDFLTALSSITPASHRSAAAHARPLPPSTAHALSPILAKAISYLEDTFPPAATCIATRAANTNSSVNTAAGVTPDLAAAAGRVGSHTAGARISGNHASCKIHEIFDSEDDEADLGEDGSYNATAAAALHGTAAASLKRLLAPSSCLQRPSLLLCGAHGAGQQHVGPALLHALEGLPVHAVGLTSLLSDPGARSLEEALVHAFIEARRAAPAILYLPHLEGWWHTAHPVLRACLVQLLEDLPSDLPLLLLATADCPSYDLDDALLDLFEEDGILELGSVGESERKAMLEPVILAAAMLPPKVAELSVTNGSSGGGRSREQQRKEEELAVDPEPLIRQQKEREARAVVEARMKYEEDQTTLRALRMGLRDVTLRLLSNKRWKLFWMPADPDEDAEYYELVTAPMDLGTVLSRVDSRQYMTPEQYLADMKLIEKATRQFYGDAASNGGDGARFVNQAAALVDEAEGMIQAGLPLELRQRLWQIDAAGGPAAAPPGVVTFEAMAAEALAAAEAAALAASSAAADGSRGHRGQKESQGVQRASGRLRGEQLPTAIVFEDPEKLMAMARKQNPRHQAPHQNDVEPPELASVSDDQMEVDGHGDVASGTSNQKSMVIDLASPLLKTSAIDRVMDVDDEGEHPSVDADAADIINIVVDERPSTLQAGCSAVSVGPLIKKLESNNKSTHPNGTPLFSPSVTPLPDEPERLLAVCNPTSSSITMQSDHACQMTMTASHADLNKISLPPTNCNNDAGAVSCEVVIPHVVETGSALNPDIVIGADVTERTAMPRYPAALVDPIAEEAAKQLVSFLVQGCDGWMLQQLEVLVARAVRWVRAHHKQEDRVRVVQQLAEDLKLYLISRSS